MCTSSRTTLVSVSSSSRTMLVPSGVEVGQQPSVTGRKASSELLYCHLRSGAGMFARKALSASFTSRTLFACEALLRFGCTLYLNSWFCGASLKHTRSALDASTTVTWNCPMQTASPLRVPSPCRLAVIFSSMSTFTGSSSGLTTGAAAGSACASAAASAGAGSGMPRPDASASPGRFFARDMPFLGAPGFRVAVLLSSAIMGDDHGGEGAADSFDMLMLLMLAMGLESLKDMLLMDVALSPLPMPGGPELSPRLRRLLVISICFFFIISRASLILLCSIIMCSLSSWLSISVYVLICESVTLSRWPKEMTSSKAKTMSKACFRTSSSLTWIWQQSCTTLASSRRVSRSSRMLLALFVTSTRCSDSMGW
mmetsp:Transcript_82687/g.267659  ORF Transcript_82687/g.267659 Transcript_82687/m.267659 type:complete len:369 (-) Transcript_82687:238-1344(-)